MYWPRALGASLDLLDQEPVRGFREQTEVRQSRVGQPFADFVQAAGDHGQAGAGGEQRRDLSRGREIAEAVKSVARLDQAEHRKLIDDLARQLAERGELSRGVGLGLLLGHALAGPGEKLPFARDRDAIGLGLREAVGGPAVIEQRPAELAHDQDVRLLGDAFARLAAVLANDLERIRAPHRREPARESNRALERRAVGFGRPRHPPSLCELRRTSCARPSHEERIEREHILITLKQYPPSAHVRAASQRCGHLPHKGGR